MALLSNNIETCLSLITVPVQLLLIATIIRFRKSKYLSSDYFKLRLSITIEGLFYCVTHVLWLVWVQWFDAMQTYPKLSCTLLGILIRSVWRGEQVVLVASAVNRAINIKYPVKAHTMWQLKHTIFVVVLQYAVVTLLALSFAHPAQHVYFTNETRLVYGIPNKWKIVESSAENWPLKNIRSKILAAMSISCAIALSILYVVMFVALHKSNKQVADHKTKQTKDKDKVEAKLAMQGFVQSSLIVMEGLMQILKVLLKVKHPLITLVYVFAPTANYYIGPFLTFAMSKELRKHARMLIFGVPPNHQAKGNPKAQKNKM